MKKILSIIRNSLLIVVFLGIILGVFAFTFFIKEQETVSLFENRNLATVDTLEDTNFADSSFQNQLEDVLSDQFYQRQKIVETKKKIDQKVTQAIAGDNPENTKLSKMGDTSVYQIGTSNYMMNGLMTYDPGVEERIIQRIDQINELAKDYPEIEFFVYRPIQGHETSIFDEMNEVETAGMRYNQLFKDLLDIPVSFLEYSTLEEYKKYYFSSDHHWNYQGAYQGYLDIMKLMNMEEDTLEAKSINCNNGLRFYGTFSNRTANVFEPDRYCLYEIDYDDVEVIVDGNVVEDTLNPKYFMSHIYEFESDPYIYHYNFSFSSYAPYAEFRTKNIDKQNLLVIGDSYARAISYYLASGFHSSYFVNPSDYVSATGKKFNYDEFLQTHSIDKVLIMYTLENYYYIDPVWGNVYENFDVVRSGEE